MTENPPRETLIYRKRKEKISGPSLMGENFLADTNICCIEGVVFPTALYEKKKEI